MLRIHFTAEDLARTRVATRVDPMWEIVGSLHHLQQRHKSLVFEDWRRSARERLRGAPALAAARMLSTLAPYDTYFPDFLTPAGAPTGLETSIDTVLSTPRHRTSYEVERMALRRPLPAWAGNVAAGEAHAMRSLGQAFESYHDAAIAPHLPRIETTLAADRSRRANALLEGGVERLLSTLGPTTRWRSPVLESRYPADVEMHLGGRGLLLVPSYFCWRMPITLADRELTPVLVYPVEHDLIGPARKDGLAALIGRTRIQVLEVVAAGVTTTEVSRRIGISPATASHHLTVLRDAGLVAGHRDANRVVYVATSLGTALLDVRGTGPPPADDQAYLQATVPSRGM
jgi:DNA-binding transcriptional ArsR family regulator